MLETPLARQFCETILQVANRCQRKFFRYQLERLALRFLEVSLTNNQVVSQKIINVFKELISIGVHLEEITPIHGQSLLKTIQLINSEMKIIRKFPNYKPISELSANKFISKNDDFIDIIVEETSEETNHDINDIIEEPAKDLNSEIRQVAILKKIKEISKQTNEDCGLKDLLASFSDISDRTLRSDVQKLCQQGIITKVGSRGPNTGYRLTDRGRKMQI